MSTIDPTKEVYEPILVREDRFNPMWRYDTPDHNPSQTQQLKKSEDYREQQVRPFIGRIEHGPLHRNHELYMRRLVEGQRGSAAHQKLDLMVRYNTACQFQGRNSKLAQLLLHQLEEYDHKPEAETPQIHHT